MHFARGLAISATLRGKTSASSTGTLRGRSDRLPELTDELIRLKIDILVTANATAARAAKAAAATIPIVVANIGNLIISGLVASLARPGGNVTGLTHYSRELIGKRLELLKEVVPKVSRFAFLNDSVIMLKDAQVAAKALAVQFQLVEVSDPPLFGFHRKRILELAEQNRIPAMHSEQEWPRSWVSGFRITE
jgi:putative ABC transport system substrate-binding protein